MYKMASSRSTVSPEALRSFRRHYFVTHWGKKVVFLIYNLSFLHRQHKNIHEILTSNEVPLGNRSQFSKQEIKNLTDKPPEDLDITVMNKICQALWQNGVNDPGDKLKGLVKKIKDERNIVSHEVPDMSETDLEHELKDFQATLEETLEETKSLFAHHSAEIDQLKAEIKDVVPKLLEKIREKHDPSNPQEVQQLQEEIEENLSAFTEVIKNSAQKELLSLYGRLHKILPFDWLAQYGVTDPSNIMVDLQMANDKEFLGEPHGNKTITVNQKEILKLKDPVGVDPEVVIISGDAGSGKTTILCSTVEGWCKKIMDMPELSSFLVVFYMQFKNHDHDNFDDYLRTLLPKAVSRYTFHHVKSAVLGSVCLVLCDGYDEANENSVKLFTEMLELNSNMKIVVTTRPGNIERLTDIVNKGKHSRINLKVLGLQEKDMNLLTEKLIGHLVKDDVNQQETLKKELLQKIKEMNYETSIILQTPLFFNLFILLYIKCPDLRDEMITRTSIFLQLKKHMIKRISNKTGICNETLKEFDALYRKWSLKYYIERKYEWSETDVKSFKAEISCQKVHQNFDAIMSSYFCIKHAKKRLDFEKVYCYRHSSEQEFAVAGSVCDDIISSRRQQGRNMIRSVLRSKLLWDASGKVDNYNLLMELREVISFITGILYSTERDVLYNTINDIHELYLSSRNFLWTHDVLLEPCTETRLDDKVLGSLVSLMKETDLKKSVRFRKTNSLLVLPSLLSKLRPKIFEFRAAPVDLSELNETLQVANHYSIYTELWVMRDLREYVQISGQVLHPVDKLVLGIVNDKDQDLDSLRPISLMSSAKELILYYDVRDDTEDRIARVINRTFPTDRAEGTTDLGIELYKECDIRHLLQSLTIRPLRSITIHMHMDMEIDVGEDLNKLCKDKGLGELRVRPPLFTDTENDIGEDFKRCSKEKMNCCLL
ncbi:uncharacterized protein [Macrobrachium rosenbergii]|uniref:uncharacterized protein n=1 Tax=Macrobrachium rosenbergii TaxID=79674 RepID=UPI0034D77889